jgi:GDP-L-fucose synthase
MSTPRADRFWQDKRVLVTGGHGFVGQSVLAELRGLGCARVDAPTRQACDLTVQSAVAACFDEARPDVVLHLAGKVGGIGANQVAQGAFFYENLMMGTLVLENARRVGVQKLVAFAAGCGYPKLLPVPHREADFWNGLPDENSVGYSMAKKMLIIQSWTYRRQYGFNSVMLLPANLYGPGDNFHIEHSHVVPALIRKFVEAVDEGRDTVTVWGSGSARREFLYVGDAARAMLRAAERLDESGPFNLGTGQETSVSDLVAMLANLTGFRGRIEWDTSRPDGQPRRFYDMSLFRDKLGYVPDTPLEAGLRQTVEWFRAHRKGFTNK